MVSHQLKIARKIIYNLTAKKWKFYRYPSEKVLGNYIFLAVGRSALAIVLIKSPYLKT